MAGVLKHRFREAFCLMEYRCEKGCCIEKIWNSRDGVTPFMVMNRKTQHMMKHVNMHKDLYAPGYTVKPSCRMFVNATPELVLPTATDYVNRNWNREGPMPMKEAFKTMKDAVDFYVKEWSKNGTEPWIVTIADKDEPKGYYLKAGDICPFICPKCQAAIQYDENIVRLKCSCGYEGTAEEFSETVLELQSRVQ